MSERRDHDVARLAAGEVEDVVQQLLLRARDDAGCSRPRRRARAARRRLRIASPATISSTPNGLRSTRAEPCSSHTTGRRTRRDQLDRPRDEHRERLGAVERERLRHELAEHDAQVGDDRERDDEASHVGIASPRRSLTSGSATAPVRMPSGGDADLDGRDDAHGVVHQAQRGRRAPPLARCERGAPRGDDRVLGDDEEGVAAMSARTARMRRASAIRERTVPARAPGPGADAPRPPGDDRPRAVGRRAARAARAAARRAVAEPAFDRGRADPWDGPAARA